MKKLYWLLLIASNCAFGTHIVGGELQLRLEVPTAYVYRLNLNLYFDAVNGNPLAEDPNLTVRLFRRRDNLFVGDAQLNRTEAEQIPYANPACVSVGGLVTRLIRYETLIKLDPARFSDPEGYYFVWERCCRNNIINNIQNPEAAAMVFYLYIPPVVKNGENFFNSSPQFEALKSDYLCINQPFYFDFSGTDPDGDELRYSMAVPLNGFASSATPLPVPTGAFNYPTILFKGGYGALSAIPGAPPLQINSQTGQLFVVPNQLGLFVFSVKIEEYRAGRKIGEVRRDFQLKVVECPKNEKPTLLLKDPAKGGTTYKKGEVLKFKANQDYCLDVLTTDPNINQVVKIISKNIVGKPTASLSAQQYTVRNTNDTLRSQLCIRDCFDGIDTRPTEIEIIASDNGCPIPQYDTIRVMCVIEGQINQKPKVSSTLANNKASILTGNTLNFSLNGVDLDNDQIQIEAKPRGFTLDAAGMSFSNPKGTGSISSGFRWNPTCAVANGKDYVIDFIISETRCGQNVPKDSVRVTLAANPAPSTKPKVSTNLPNNTTTVVIDLQNPQNINFNVNGQDPDNEDLTLVAIPKGFDLKKLGISFENKNGKYQLTSAFGWTPLCEALEGAAEKTFVIDFVVADNSCQSNRFDTTTVRLNVRNLPVNEDVRPPNVITPNNDGKNDFFEITNLPPDNCDFQFVSISIFNRWGQEVFLSPQRDFKWKPENEANGEFFYEILFTKKRLKGGILVLR